MLGALRSSNKEAWMVKLKCPASFRLRKICAEIFAWGESTMTRHGVFAMLALIIGLRTLALAQHDHSMNQKPAAKPAATKAVKPSLTPAEGASIKIISPAKGQVLKGDKVPLEYKLTRGKRGNHAHAYVDGELMGMFESEKGTLNGIKPGNHILELRVVASDHVTELDAIDKVTFTVK
jgi:hypothetical protein